MVGNHLVKLVLGVAMVLGAGPAGAGSSADRFAAERLVGDWSASSTQMWDLRFHKDGRVEEVELGKASTPDDKLKGKFAFASNKELILTFKADEDVVEVECEFDSDILLCRTGEYVYEYHKQ